MMTVINQSYRLGLQGISERQGRDCHWLDTVALEQACFDHLNVMIVCVLS